MKKIIIYFGVVLFASCFIISCGNSSPSQADKDKIIKEYQDSIALAEKAKQDSINTFVPDIKVNLFVIKDIYYDSEGWPVEAGKIQLIKDFQKKKEYKYDVRNGYYQHLEKLEIVGKSENITLQFINGESNKIVHEEKVISINGTKTYSNSDVFGQEQQHYQQWLRDNGHNLIIKVTYKNKVIFEGKISS